MDSTEKVIRRYYSSRKGAVRITPSEARWRLENLYLLYSDKDYFKERLGVRGSEIPANLARESAIRLGFPAFPISRWTSQDTTEDHVFDVIEFLYDHVSKPGKLIDMVNEGWAYLDYQSYDQASGRAEFTASSNLILWELGEGFELGADGQVRANGTGGLQHIIKAEIVAFDEKNVDSKVVAAIERWRQRHATLDDKKEAIRLLADVLSG